MHSSYYQMAGLLVQAESDQPSPTIGYNATGFEARAGAPDITLSFLAYEPATDPPQTPEPHEIETIIARTRCFNGHWNSPFLRSSQLRTHLLAPQTDPDRMTVESLDLYFRLLDFSQSVQTIYHSTRISASTFMTMRGEFLFAPMLAQHDGMLLHASCVVRGGRAALFLGPDGRGKSTVANSQSEGAILCDDQVIVRLEESGFSAHGTPWGKVFCPNLSGPLGALFMLEQADRFSLDRISPHALFEYIWDEHAYYHLPLPIKLRPRAFDLVYRLCHSRPAFRMRFGKDDIDWQAIDAVLSVKHPL